jgi:hypothetical protein
MNGYTKRILATTAASLARLLGMPITIQAGDITMKAMPEDRPDSVLARSGINPDQEPPVDPPMVPQSDWKLNLQPGPVDANFIGPPKPCWIGTPDPNYRGETRRVVPFDNFEEGK